MDDKRMTKLMEVAADFSIMLERAVKDVKQDNFKMEKFFNQMDSFCDDSKKKIRGY